VLKTGGGLSTFGILHPKELLPGIDRPSWDHGQWLYTSAFHGIGKGKAFTLLNNSEEFQLLFSEFGDSFTFESTLFPKVEIFLCRLYGLKCNNTDEARYQKFVANKKTPEPQKLPPKRDVLLCHCKWVSYVTAVIKRSIQRDQHMLSPSGYGWISTEEATLTPQWTSRSSSTDLL